MLYHQPSQDTPWGHKYPYEDSIHQLQIWWRMHESEAFWWQPLLRADSLTCSLIRVRIVYTFVQAISSKISQEKAYLWKDMVYQSFFNTSEANLRSVNKKQFCLSSYCYSNVSCKYAMAALRHYFNSRNYNCLQSLNLLCTYKTLSER